MELLGLKLYLDSVRQYHCLWLKWESTYSVERTLKIPLHFGITFALETLNTFPLCVHSWDSGLCLADRWSSAHCGVCVYLENRCTCA